MSLLKIRIAINGKLVIILTPQNYNEIDVLRRFTKFMEDYQIMTSWNGSCLQCKALYSLFLKHKQTLHMLLLFKLKMSKLIIDILSMNCHKILDKIRDIQILSVVTFQAQEFDSIMSHKISFLKAGNQSSKIHFVQNIHLETLTFNFEQLFHFNHYFLCVKLINIFRSIYVPKIRVKMFSSRLQLKFFARCELLEINHFIS